MDVRFRQVKLLRLGLGKQTKMTQSAHGSELQSPRESPVFCYPSTTPACLCLLYSHKLIDHVITDFRNRWVMHKSLNHRYMGYVQIFVHYFLLENMQTVCENSLKYANSM